MILGRAVSVWPEGRDVLIAWGDDELTARLKGDVAVPDSLATIYDDWAGERRGALQRLAAFWPGRIWQVGHGSEAVSAALRALAEDPPIVWWGRGDRLQAYDVLQWSDLGGRVRRFLDSLPLDTPPRS
jgi:hypothetical protein